MNLQVSIKANHSAFGGDVVLRRDFFNPGKWQDGKGEADYISLEAHEVGSGTGIFNIAYFVPEGNAGGVGEVSYAEALRHMHDFSPPAGMVEMDIPEEAWA